MEANRKFNINIKGLNSSKLKYEILIIERDEIGFEYEYKEKDGRKKI